MVLTLVSVAVGWWLAGRVLSPLNQITATARRLSLSNLHERIALTGPRDELKDLADTFDTMLARLERSAEASAGSSPTPRTNCGHRWPSSGRRSRSAWTIRPRNGWPRSVRTC